MHLKRMLSVALLGVVVGLTTGLTATASRSETVTLRLLQQSAFKQAQDLLNANFERVYPNIHIDTTYADGATILSTVLTQLQAGNGPDVWDANPAKTNPNSVWLLGESGKLLDLSNRPWVKRIPTAFAKDSVSSNGKVYGWPFNYGVFGVFYNTALFNQLHLKAPTSTAQVLALCRTVAAAGKIPFSLGLAGGSNGSLINYQQIAGEMVFGADPNWIAKRTKGQVQFATSPLWHRAYQSLLDMRSAGCFNPSPEGTTFAQSLQMIANGQAVMTLSSALLAGPLQAINPATKYGMFAFPSTTAKTTVALTTIAGALVGNAATAHAAEVRTYIDFMARAKQNALFVKVAGGFDGFSLKKGILPNYMKSMNPLFTAGRTFGNANTVLPNPNLFFGVLAGYLPGLFTGQKSVDDILKAADYMWDHPDATAPQ